MIFTEQLNNWYLRATVRLLTLLNTISKLRSHPLKLMCQLLSLKGPAMLAQPNI